MRDRDLNYAAHYLRVGITQLAARLENLKIKSRRPDGSAEIKS
jgi:hypothetical protein